MAEELEQGTNDNTMSAESGTPQDTNTQEQQGTIRVYKVFNRRRQTKNFFVK